MKELLTNILITGGGSLTNGLTQRVLNDLYKSLHQYFPNYLYTQPGRLILGTVGSQHQQTSSIDWDKKFGSWLGACNLAGMLNGNVNTVNESNGGSNGSANNGSENENSVNIALDNWYVTKSDYEELGEDLILEKFK